MAAGTGPVVCFGEMLWDELPGGRRPGGAPMNVACHLARLGRRVVMVSAVGEDEAGQELLAFLEGEGVETVAVGRVAGRRTGEVRAWVDEAGNARYVIEPDVAWDGIPVEGGALAEVGWAAALVFGSLAQRSAANRHALRRLRGALAEGALEVFDVNLRAPHDEVERVMALAQGVDVLKVNQEEAARLVGGPMEALEGNARRLAECSGAGVVCVTAGAAGAGLWREGEWMFEPGRRVTVVDTVGAGDGFVAALVDAVLAGRGWAAALAAACRRGEAVAGQAGAL